jgi:hypothetical protein
MSTFLKQSAPRTFIRQAPQLNDLIGPFEAVRSSNERLEGSSTPLSAPNTAARYLKLIELDR